MRKMTKQSQEILLTFDCQGEPLLGVIHQPAKVGRIGVLIVVGGPQYRIGSHRQFLLLARYLAESGITVMRFDVRGMGDSWGEPRAFDQLNQDIAAAVTCLLDTCPGIDRVVLWGLCDAASAAAFYAYNDARIKGMVLLNPWVFTEQGAAKTYLKHYYLKRLLSRDFWKKVLSFKVDAIGSLVSLLDFFKKAAAGHHSSPRPGTVNQVDAGLALPARMRESLYRFSNPVLLILSGRDLVADEFKGAVNVDPLWQTLLERPEFTRYDLPDADHTFASAAWRNQVAEWTLYWLRQLD